MNEGENMTRYRYTLILNEHRKVIVSEYFLMDITTA